jgi:uncharacterized membrane protein
VWLEFHKKTFHDRPMTFDWYLWTEYFLRFSHLVAGIAWIGSSFYFIWLDSAFEPLKAPRKNVEGETFMVHGGFYYRVEKRKIFPGELPKVLHWFKWEATLTWLTGWALFIVLYFLRGASLLIDPQVRALSQGQAIFGALSFAVVSWFIYDTLWSERLKRVRAFTGSISVAILLATPFLLSQVFSGRGVFMLMGVLMGTMMLLNVWIRILPGQAKMLREAQSGQVPDFSVSLKSKTRSVHNTYFIFPVLFIMLSNHYPSIYNHPQHALLLVLLAISGALIRHAMVTRVPSQRWTLMPAALGIGALVLMTAQPADSQAELMRLSADGLQGAPVEYTQVAAILNTRCLSCHSNHTGQEGSSIPADEWYPKPPKGIVFENESQVRARADRIFQHVVVAKSMPLANKTQMKDEERQTIGLWIKQQGLLK